MLTTSPNELSLDHRRRVLKAMLYLDTHLSKVVSTKELARIACFSPFHFQRVFLAFTGETVGQYQQRKRLERAAKLLADGQKSILEIALEVGYETPAALTKLFKRWTGETPSGFRKNPSPSIHRLFRTLTPPRLPGRPHLKPYFQDLPELHIIFIEVYGMQEGNFINAVRPAFEEMHSWVMRNQLSEQIRFWVGLIPHKPSHLEDPATPFWFGIAMTDLPKLTIRFSTFTLPAGKIAVFIHKGPHEYLLQTWNHAYYGWLPESGRTLRDIPPFERYLSNPRAVLPDKMVTEVCVPICTSEALDSIYAK